MTLVCAVIFLMYQSFLAVAFSSQYLKLMRILALQI